MRRILTLCVALAATGIGASTAAADQTPFPAPQLSLSTAFVAAQTVLSDGSAVSWVAPGSTVIFRGYAVDMKTKKVAAQKDVKYFYVTIPNQPNVKLTWNPTAPGASTGIPFTGKWLVPSSYPAGVVNFAVHVQLKAKRRGTFQQLPIAASQLNISPTPPAAVTPGAPAGALNPGQSGAASLSLYVDAVNGGSVPGVAVRPIGCTITNVFHRGEKVVIRGWGIDLSTGNVLSLDNVSEAHFSISGQPDVALNWGLHGATGAKVYFWSNFWAVPADFPLGNTTIHVAYKLVSGKTGTFDYPVNIIP